MFASDPLSTVEYHHCAAPSLCGTVTVPHCHYATLLLGGTITGQHSHYAAPSLYGIVSVRHCHCAAPSLCGIVTVQHLSFGKIPSLHVYFYCFYLYCCLHSRTIYLCLLMLSFPVSLCYLGLFVCLWPHPCRLYSVGPVYSIEFCGLLSQRSVTYVSCNY